MRFLEPIGGFLFNLYIMRESTLFLQSRGPQNSDRFCFFVFFLGAAIYGQGAGFHSAANMFKNGLESVLAVNDDDQAKALHYWMRTVWQHEVSHYLYAVGNAMMAACQAWKFRNYTLSQDSTLSWSGKLLLLAAACSYGLLVCGVAVNFPSGIIVGLIYLLGYGMCVIGGYMLYLHLKAIENIRSFSCRPILHFFVLSYFIGVILVFAWIGYAGGAKTRSQALG